MRGAGATKVRSDVFAAVHATSEPTGNTVLVKLM
jgi:hypothetical protein